MCFCCCEIPMCDEDLLKDDCLEPNGLSSLKQTLGHLTISTLDTTVRGCADLI